MADSLTPSLNRCWKIAKDLSSEGVIYCESVPIDRWRKQGWPTDKRSFVLIDSIINFIRTCHRVRVYPGCISELLEGIDVL